MYSAQRVIKYLAISFGVIIMWMIFSVLFSVGMLLSYIAGNFDNQEQTGMGEMVVISELEEMEMPKELELKVGLANVRIVKGEKFKIETNNEYVKSERNGSKLVIREEDHAWSWGEFWPDDIKGEVMVYLTSELLERLRIEMGAGTLDAESLAAGIVELEFGAGRSTISELYATHSAKINGGAGLLEIRGGCLQDLDFDMGVGKVVLRSELLGKAKIEAGLGALDVDLLGRVGQYQLDVEHGLGAVNLNGQKLEGEIWGDGENLIKIDGGVGAINLRVEGSVVEREG